MLIIPAIDLKDGQCVRLRQGRMDESTVYGEDPLAMASHWRDQGGRRLHLVDLNGAFAGNPVNGDSIRAIAREHSDIPIQIGGGIRSLDTIDYYLNAGVTYCIIGTQAVRDPDFVARACAAYPGHIIVGLDAHDGYVATDGWADVSEVRATDLARRFAADGISGIVYTDISRDGMLQGVNWEQTLELAQAAGIPVIASGGVSNMDDVRQMATLPANALLGAITGRAIYENTLDLSAAQKWLDQHANTNGQGRI